MKLDLSSLPTLKEVANAVTAVAPLKVVTGVAAVLLAGKLIPDHSESYTAWYPTLEKPKWHPPGWAFPAIWIPLKVAQGCALAIVADVAAADVTTGPGVDKVANVLSSASSSNAVRALAVFAGMTALGNYWNVTFFGRRQLKKSRKVMAAFWASVAATIAAFNTVDRNAAALVAPTLAWVTVATALNFKVVSMNEGKGAKED